MTSFCPVFDTFVDCCERKKDFNGRGYLSVGTQEGCRHRAIIRFDLDSLPAGASITSATLKLNAFNYWYPCRTKVYQIHRITESYSDQRMNWCDQPPHDSVALGQFVVDCQAKVSLEVDLLSLVTGWQRGRYQNYGIMIGAQNEKHDNLIGIASEEYPDPLMRPVLVVKYETATGVIPGIGSPGCDVGSEGDIYVDVSSGNHYYKLSSPVPVPARPIPTPTGSTLLVGSTRTYTTIQAALAAASNGDRLLLDAETFSITNTIAVNKSVTIEGQGMASTTVIATTLAPSPYFMFNVTVSDVIFRSMKLVQDYPRSPGETDTVIAVNNAAALGIYVDSCEIGVSELGLWLKAAEFQVTNCVFTYAPNAMPGNNYSCILVSVISGDCIIHNNTFVSGSQNTGCFFIRLTNEVPPGFTGNLVVSGNTQSPSPYTMRHLLAMEEYLGNDFKLFLDSNKTVFEGNVPVLLYAPDLDIFSFIRANANDVQNSAGKGFIGIDAGSQGTTPLFASDNAIANQSFASGWASATAPPTFVAGYRTTIVPPPVLSTGVCYWLPLI